MDFSRNRTEQDYCAQRLSETSKNLDQLKNKMMKSYVKNYYIEKEDKEKNLSLFYSNQDFQKEIQNKCTRDNSFFSYKKLKNFLPKRASPN